MLGSEFGSEELEELGSVFSGEDGSGSGLDVYGPGDSSDVNAFILPALDFSSSFLAQPQPQSTGAELNLRCPECRGLHLGLRPLNLGPSRGRG